MTKLVIRCKACKVAPDEGTRQELERAIQAAEVRFGKAFTGFTWYCGECRTEGKIPPCPDCN